MNLLKFFTFKKHYIDYPLTKEVFTNKKILSYGDLFKVTGILEAVAEISDDEKYYYANLRANKQTTDKIYAMIKDHVLNTKNKYSKLYKEKALLSMCAFDNLMFSPKDDERVPDDTIRVLKRSHKEFREVNN